jgi:hypothetical protein
MSAPAFKEWAVIVRALLEGEQIVDVRKGGLREAKQGNGRRHFAVHANRFWLYPTSEHQQPELLKDAYRHTIELSPGSPVGESIRIDGWADVVGVARVTEPDLLAKLDSKLIWTLDYAESRLKWKQRDPLWILALRVHRLHEHLVVPWRDDYGGCTSWVPVEGLPEDPASLPSVPALSDEAFDARLQGVVNELPDGLTEPEVVGAT